MFCELALPMLVDQFECIIRSYEDETRMQLTHAVTVRGETLETAHLHNLCLKGRTSFLEHDEDFSQVKALIMSQKILGLHDLQEP
jgi:hypothetical protein